MDVARHLIRDAPGARVTASGPANADSSSTTPEANFSWGILSGADFSQALEAAYAEAVHWRRNVFKIPSGRAGKDFTAEMARLFRSYAEASSLESVAIKAAMVLPLLTLQKPSSSSKCKEHAELLSRRLQVWLRGDLDSLIREGRVIQQHLRFSHSRQTAGRNPDDQLASKFAKQMLVGNTRAALRLLSQSESGNQTRVLPVHQLVDPNQPSEGTVLDSLKAKHPTGQPAHPDALLERHNNIPGPEYHPVIFDGITAESIRKTVLRCGGAAGPSGLDAAAWQRLCTAFKGSSRDLCTALSLLARRICTESVSPAGLSAFTSCRLIALDKNPGVRPIGIAEVARRIIGKAILSIVRPDIQQVAGSTQLCAGQEGGCEAAVHAMRLIYSSDTCQGALMVDASNAFNRLNRRVALQNVSILCPSLSTILNNIYEGDASLFVDGETIRSEEGTTQGDPLAMAFYALATLPLIAACKVEQLDGEAWFADDATGAGALQDLRKWWDHLSKEGPKFGYFPNGSKTWLVVKEAYFIEAVDIFRGTDVHITTEGRRHLGAALGTERYTTNFVEERVKVWTSELDCLASIARSQPQAAYSALCHGLPGKWLFLARTMPDVKELLLPLEMSLRQCFLPALTGRSAPGDIERRLLALPARHGGLGISQPHEIAAAQHRASMQLTADLVRALTHKLLIPEGTIGLQYSKAEVRRSARLSVARSAETLHAELHPSMQHARLLASEKGSSSWLTVLPLVDHGFALPKGAFRDALCLRYGWSVPNLPSTCVCGSSFGIEHALSCRFGGLPIRRHNEIRDLMSSCLRKVCGDVAVEPALQPLSGEVFKRRTTKTDPEARLDVKAAGFWGGRSEEAFFDVRVFNPFAPSYRSSPIATVYRRHEKEKRDQYEERVREVERASFTPLVFAATGGASGLTTAFLKRLASLLADKTDSSYGVTLAWLRARVNFSLLRSAVACLRSTRRKRFVTTDDVEPQLAVSQARLQW